MWASPGALQRRNVTSVAWFSSTRFTANVLKHSGGRDSRVVAYVPTSRTQQLPVSTGPVLLDTCVLRSCFG